jgi:hypothetical protein
LPYFLKNRLSLTALVAGSMVPDFEYFVRVDHRSSYTHTWTGLFWLDLPAGLALCFLFHGLIKQPLFYNVPLFLKKRMATAHRLQWSAEFKKKWFSIFFCLLLGATSHLVWDKFTHRSVHLVQATPPFRKYAEVIDKDMTYDLVWDFNSVIGMGLLLYSLWAMPLSQKETANKNTHFYWLAFSITAFALYILQATSIHLNILDNYVIAGINAILIGLLMASLTDALFRRRRQKGNDSAALSQHVNPK